MEESQHKQILTSSLFGALEKLDGELTHHERIKVLGWILNIHPIGSPHTSGFTHSDLDELETILKKHSR